MHTDYVWSAKESGYGRSSRWEYRTKGKATQARNICYPDLIGYASCSPEDDYDLNIGIKVAALKADVKWLEEALESVNEVLAEYMN